MAAVSPADISPAERGAIDEEAAELKRLAASLAAHAPDVAPKITALTAAFDETRVRCDHPYEAEQCAERFARDLRRCWLEYAAATTAFVYRSPTHAQIERLEANDHETFGYEREMQPETLERRCARFYPAAPIPWQVDHILFSSGQSALTAALLALQYPAVRAKLSIAHVGAYFETRALIEAQTALLELVAEERAADADCLVIEPISCGGRFARVDLDVAANYLSSAPYKRRVVIFDSTLLGCADDTNRFLRRVPADGSFIVMRLCSGLKLFQAGLELANVGILSVYAPASDIDEMQRHLRRLRALTGTGLRLADTIALEAPWVFDANHTRVYQFAVFSHNAALVSAVNGANELFEPLRHPALDGADAPYCVFHLRHASDEGYVRLGEYLDAQAHSRRLQFERGGSFGFRGHRFDIIRPENGEAPFLRVAMGRRGGWSCNGVIEMFRELAARTTLPV